MGNVWVVLEDAFEDRTNVIGVCSSKEKAVAVKNYYESLDDCWHIYIEEFGIDRAVDIAIERVQNDIQKLETKKILLNELRKFD